MSNMIVSEAQSDDEESVVALWRACGLIVSYNDPARDFRFAIAGPGSAILIGKGQDGRVIGSVMVGHDGHRGWLYYVASAPDRRGAGIGRAMVEAGEQWLRERNVPKVQLMVRPTNRPVVSFYERLGYEDTPRVLMSKWLNPRE
jgi:ribosomal protein S18 acetylase RimI-like enzyme